MPHRLFIAVDLPESVRRQLARLVADAPGGVRPVRPEQLHLTLHFIGDTDDAAVAALAAALAACGTSRPARRTERVSPHRPRESSGAAFAIDITGVGVFPPRGRPAVLWAGVADDDDLRTLHADVAAALASCGFAAEPRPWMPHVTLARLTPRAPRAWTTAFLDRHRDLAVPGIPVGSFRLYESTRTAEGTVHTTVATVPLGPESPA